LVKLALDLEEDILQDKGGEKTAEGAPLAHAFMLFEGFPASVRGLEPDKAWELIEEIKEGDKVGEVDR